MCKFKIDKITYSKHNAAERITLPKINIQCIIKLVMKNTEAATRGACNFIKKRLQHRCFPANIGKILKTPILRNICERLLLKIVK